MERDCDALMIHDYQLYFVPAMLREAGVDAPITARVIAMIHEIEIGARDLDELNLVELEAQLK